MTAKYRELIRTAVQYCRDQADLALARHNDQELADMWELKAQALENLE